MSLLETLQSGEAGVTLRLPGSATVRHASADQTGLRESIRLVKAGLSGDPRLFLPQSEYDDPAHDAAFPAHPLSAVRAAQAWARAGEATSAEALGALVDAALPTWRRLSAPPSKPWWRLW